MRLSARSMAAASRIIVAPAGTSAGSRGGGEAGGGFIGPWRSRRITLKERERLLGGRLAGALGAPGGPMLDDPVEQSLLEADVMTGFFAFDPLVSEYLLTLRQELLVEQGFSDEVVILGSGC